MEDLAESNVNSIPPNWCKFMRQKFVRSSEEEQVEIQKQISSRIEIQESASEFYQEVLQLPSNLKPSVPKPKNFKKRKVDEVKVEFSKELLFRLATNDDAEGLEKHLRESIDPDVNATDTFGWTALMMAACEGSINSFQVLLENGVDLNVSDRCGSTAASLAERNKQKEILDLIDAFKNQSNVIEISDDEEEEVHQVFFCPDCKIQLSETSPESHQTSTVHLINCKFMGNTDIRSFGIAHSNKGYKLMKTLGWDGSSALGSKKTGKLYPIKTVLRKGRSGLGIEQGKAKVTHFKANDVRAIKFQPKPRAATRKEIELNSLKEKKREQMLRRELS